MRYKFRQSVMVALVAVFMLPISMFAFPQTAYAAADRPGEQLDRWLMYRGMWACLDQSIRHTTLTRGEVNDGKWPIGDKKGFGYLGPSLDGGNDADGTVQCDDKDIWVKGASDFGFQSPVEFLCALDRALATNGEPGALKTDKSKCEDSQEFSFSSGKWEEALTKALDNEGDKNRPRFDIENNNGPGYSYKALQYLLGKRSLEVFCGSGVELSQGLSTKENDKNRVSVHVVDPETGDIQKSQLYVLKGSRDEDSKVDDVTWKTGGSRENAEDLRCHEMAKLTRENADAYAEWARENRTLAIEDSNYAGSGTDAGNDEGTCESIGGALSYLACPVLYALDGTIGFLSSQVENLLDVDEATYRDDGVEQAAKNFRNLAGIILVPMILFMVIGTAIGVGPFDAYTVKKAAPRLFAAIIFISLSLPITQFLIELSNTVGRGVSGLILSASDSPFSLAEAYGSTEGMVFTGAVLAFGGIGIYAAASGLAGAILLIIGSLALVTFVSLLIAFLVLVLRELLLSLLIMLAPLAILVWIFPGNDKLWNIWKTTFTALLMMFPIIMALIASGKVFAGIIDNTESDLFGFFMKVVAVIMPFFLIPATFKFGLGVFGNLAGMINDRSRGFFDRQRKFREGQKARAHKDIMESRNSLGTGRVGRGYRRVATGNFGLTARQRRTFNNDELIRTQNAVKESLEADGGRGVGDDLATKLAVQDNMTASKFIKEYMQEGHTIDEAKDALGALEAGLGARIGSSNMRVAAFKARAASSTAYDGSDKGTQDRINEGGALIAAGLMTAADATAAGKGNRARLDISGNGFGAQMTTFQEAAESIAKGGNGMTLSQAEAYLDETLNGAEPGDMLAGNTRTVEAMAPAMIRKARKADEGLSLAKKSNDQAAIQAAQQEYDRALGQIAGVYDNINRTSPQKAALFADNVMSVKLGNDSSKTTIRQAIEDAGNRSTGPQGEQTFLEVRKEWSSAARKAGADQVPETPEG